MIVLLVVSLLIGILADILLMRVLMMKRYPFSVIISLCVTFILYEVFESHEMIIKGFLLAQVLIVASYIDAKTKIIPDSAHFVIILVGLIGFDPIRSFLGLVLVPLPLLIAAMLKSDGMGGGDIKLMGACGFLLGTVNGYVATVIGLTLAVIISKAYQKDKSSGIALAPFLGIGSFLAYLTYLPRGVI